MATTKRRGDDNEPQTQSGRSGHGTGTGRKKGTQTVPFGESWINGDLSGLGSKPGVWSANNPENVWWSNQEGLNSLSGLWSLLNSMSQGDALSGAYTDLFNTLKGIALKDGSLNPDWLISIFQNLLGYYTESEKRQYEWKMLQESRQYSNPTNELARYMGAGISRDAALQMMSGSSGVGSGVSGASAAPIQSPVAGAGAAALNSSNAHANLVSNALNGVNTAVNALATLTNMGISVAEAVPQIQMLNAQNTMTQENLEAYQSVNDVVKQLQALQLSGVIEPADIDSWHNANDVYKWLLDHSETNGVKPLIDNGSFQRTFGTQIGRSMFNKHWSEQNKSRTDGEILDQFIRHNQLQNTLLNFNSQKAFFDVQYAIGELSKQDVEIQKLWNDVWLGNIGLEIAGIEKEIIGYDRDIKSYAAHQAKVQDEIFTDVFETSQTGSEDMFRSAYASGQGKKMIAYYQWQSLMDQTYKSFCMGMQAGNPAARKAWAEYYKNHREAMFFSAGILRTVAQMQNTNIDPEQSPFWSSIIGMYTLLQQCGAMDFFKFGSKVGLEALPWLL